MSTPKIEKGIPIPPKAHKSGPLSEAIRELEAGDSFLVESEHERNNALTLAKRMGVGLTTRAVDGEGFRVWRVK